MFDDQWNLVALHHSGGWIPEPSTSSTHFRDEGVLISGIVADMRSVGLAHGHFHLSLTRMHDVAPTVARTRRR
ncbi:MAG: hypothetical protein AB7O92_04330 [Acidimicrobiia bacterium]